MLIVMMLMIVGLLGVLHIAPARHHEDMPFGVHDLDSVP